MMVMERAKETKMARTRQNEDSPKIQPAKKRGLQNLPRGRKWNNWFVGETWGSGTGVFLGEAQLERSSSGRVD
jgi:hypothetical protein